jgi:hypothetical protein
VGEAFSPSRRVAHYTLTSLARVVREAGLVLLEKGAALPVDSPAAPRASGLDLEVEAPWFTNLSGRVARRVLHGLGRVEVAVAGSTRLAPSLYVVAGRPAAST